MAKIKVIKKNDEYSSDYKVGDILEVTGTWYGGFNVNSVTGIPLCLDKDECEEILEKTDLSHEEYEEAASYWKKKDAESVKLDEAKLKKAVEEYILANKTCALATGSLYSIALSFLPFIVSGAQSLPFLSVPVISAPIRERGMLTLSIGRF